MPRAGAVRTAVTESPPPQKRVSPQKSPGESINGAFERIVESGRNGREEKAGRGHRHVPVEAVSRACDTRRVESGPPSKCRHQPGGECQVAEFG